MGKPSRKRVLKDNEAKAVARNLRISPRKLDLVAGLIRGKKVQTALADLTFSKKRIAKDVKKCLDSAIANAENNHQLDVDTLVVSEPISASRWSCTASRRAAAAARHRSKSRFPTSRS
jgi:large subunit ribosomal protein L22